MKLRNALAFFLTLFLAFPVFAEDCGCQKKPIELAMNVGMMAGSNAAPAAPAYLLLWDGDTCTGNSRADAKGTTGTCGDETGALTTATIINTDEANYYANFVSSNETFIFDLTGSGWDEDEFYLRLIVKPVASTGDDNLFEYYVNADNKLEVLLYNGGANSEATVNYTANGSLNNNNGDDNGIEYLQDGYYGVIEVKLSAANDVLSIRVCSTVGADCFVCNGSEPWDTTIDTGGPDIEALVGNDATVTFGEATMGGIADGVHITELELRTYANAP